MGLLNEMKLVKGVAANQTVSAPVSHAEEGFRNAEMATQNALLALGKKVYETEKDDAGSKYLADIQSINSFAEKENLWQLYRLSLEGKTRCDSCGAIITSDSLFCNKCAASVPARDFSAIGISLAGPAAASDHNKKCPNCGHPVPEDMMFCEKCGTKVGDNSQRSVDADSSANKDSCPKCGAKLIVDAAFCEKCGERLK